MDNQPNIVAPNPEPAPPTAAAPAPTPTPSPTEPGPPTPPVKIKHAHKFIFGYLALIILVAAVAGVYEWQHNKLDSANQHVTTLQAQLKAAQQSKQNTSTQKPINVSDVTQLITNFYKQYIACTAAGNLNQTCTDNLVAADGTVKLAFYYRPPIGHSYSADPIMCAQANPNSISVSGVALTSTGASGIVTESFNPPDKVNFTVVNQSGSPKVDTITCNPPLIASQGAP